MSIDSDCGDPPRELPSEKELLDGTKEARETSWGLGGMTPMSRLVARSMDPRRPFQPRSPASAPACPLCGDTPSTMDFLRSCGTSSPSLLPYAAHLLISSGEMLATLSACASDEDSSVAALLINGGGLNGTSWALPPLLSAPSAAPRFPYMRPLRGGCSPMLGRGGGTLMLGGLKWPRCAPLPAPAMPLLPASWLSQPGRAVWLLKAADSSSLIVDMEFPCWAVPFMGNLVGVVYKPLPACIALPLPWYAPTLPLGPFALFMALP
mmetsp:Transcript_28441/g.91049  ORF Transcript_28441/g.91049 Transcript_28441/m.91049 type:complete len:265 (-) Transcript_28441:738-1532(-)